MLTFVLSVRTPLRSKSSHFASLVVGYVPTLKAGRKRNKKNIKKTADPD